MEVHETTAIGKANKCNIEDDEALAEVRKYPCLYPMFSFFYVNEIFDTSETKKSECCNFEIGVRITIHFTSSELFFSLSEISRCEPSVLTETISGQKYSH